MSKGELNFRFGVLAALGGVVLLGALVLGVYGATHPVQHVTKKDVAKAVADVAGDQNLYAICEANLTQSVTGAGGTVRSYKRDEITHKGNTAKVTVTLTSDVYIGKLTCTLTKSNWQVQQVAPGG